MIKYQAIDVTNLVRNLMFGDLGDLDGRFKEFKRKIKEILVREKGHTNVRFLSDDGDETTFWLKLERPLNDEEKESERKVEAFYEERDRNTLKSLLIRYGVPEEFQ